MAMTMGNEVINEPFCPGIWFSELVAFFIACLIEKELMACDKH